MIRPRLLVLGAVLTVLAAAATVPSTTGAFSAKTPTAATVATNSAWTCAEAVAQETANAVLSYAFDESSAETSSPGKAVDSTARHNDGTYTGERNKSGARGICYRDQAGYPYVLKGSGTTASTSGFVQTPSVALGTAWTVEVWFSTSTSSTAAASRPKTGFLLATGSGTADATSPAAGAVGLYMTDDGRLAFAVAGGATSVMTPAGTSYADGYWYHVAAVVSPTGGASLYVNGRLIGTARPASALPATTGAWRIGYGSRAGWPQAPSVGSFSGSLRFASMYATALSATAIAQHAAAGSGTRTSDNTAPDYRG